LIWHVKWILIFSYKNKSRLINNCFKFRNPILENGEEKKIILTNVTSLCIWFMHMVLLLGRTTEKM
jgi:hypothetical protein